MRSLCCFAFIVFFFAPALPSSAQTLTISNAKIEWKVVNRFRLFRDPSLFKQHEDAWRQYLTHIDALPLTDEAKAQLVQTSSVLGIEHVLNDRYIPFSQILRRKFDWRGWGVKTIGQTCWDEKSQTHSACGGTEAYVSPKSHSVEFRIQPLSANPLLNELNCIWRIGDSAPEKVPCDEPVVADIPYPAGANVSVNAEGETGLSSQIAVRDILIAGLGDSFASGEGNPDKPVQLAQDRRSKNVLPTRLINDVSGGAVWLDEKCHRSVYSYQLRAALQVAIENPKTAVTFLGYSCSGATVEEGLIGSQDYVGYISDGNGSNPTVSPLRGSAHGAQIYKLLSDLCETDLEEENGIWQCPSGKLKRTVDYLFLSVGGNDIGFSNLVAWATLRRTVSTRIAKFFGATVSPTIFAAKMQDELPLIYAKLAKMIEDVVPIRAGEIGYDPSHVIISAYPDILVDEQGGVCDGDEGGDELIYPSNQSLDAFGSWLVVTKPRLQRAHEQLEKLHNRMGDLAEDHGWTFAGSAYSAQPFRGHGFCAQNAERRNEATEELQIPCWRLVSDSTGVCETSWRSGERRWFPFDPASENFPYALRQRWVRSFNDAYLLVNEKAVTKSGRIDERASAAVFSETTGAMHPTAEGQAALADAMLIDLRASIERLTGQRN